MFCTGLQWDDKSWVALPEHSFISLLAASFITMFYCYIAVVLGRAVNALASQLLIGNIAPLLGLSAGGYCHRKVMNHQGNQVGAVYSAG